MSERQPPDLAALQAPRAAGQRLLRLAGAPQALGRLAALALWPTSAGFEPLAAMNGESAVGPAAPDSIRTASGDTAAPLPRGARRPAPRVLNTAPGSQAAPVLPSTMARAAPSSTLPSTPPSTPIISGTAPASAHRPARLPDPREVVAVMEALLQRPRQHPRPPSLRPMQAETAPLAPPPATQSAAALLGALVATTQRRSAVGLGMPPQSARQAVPLPGGVHPIGREQAVLAALQAAAAAPPVLAPLDTLRRPRPDEQPSAAQPSRSPHMLAPSELAPRAASRLLQAAPAAAPPRQHLDPTAPDADGDELLDAITRGLVDQAWLRGVNLG